ncbi:MAG TPA: zf-TFIIB domain-containing protein [Blastocatellia bacterium]|jgi:Zn-finger nucleic acid-binding protein|nr:zf-TFIIB domain-containing protein [Blastocatellia bacterium]
MSGAWDDRKKSLEEEYFHRKEQEALEKLRAQREAEGQALQAQAASLKCPKCDGTLVEVSHDGIQIDQCDKCNGVWLDAGELERLTNHEESAGWLRRLIKNVSS